MSMQTHFYLREKKRQVDYRIRKNPSDFLHLNQIFLTTTTDRAIQDTVITIACKVLLYKQDMTF